MKITTLSPNSVKKMADYLGLSEPIDMKGTTDVAEKDLGQSLSPTYVNAPDELTDAVQRLLQVEMLLEDLSRAIEIASVMRNIDMLDSFKQSADTYLQGKIQIKQPDNGPMKITIVTDDLDA
jgi:hypothetical protein